MGTAAKILLIDDEPLVREELGGLLEDEGYQVITAADGAEGLERFRSMSPDMVITDVRMPHRDGLSLAMMIRWEAPTVPVTVITGHGNYAMVVEALRAGVTDFIRKPVRLDDLRTAIGRMEAALRMARFQPIDLPDAVNLLECSWTYRLDNDIDAVPAFVDVLLSAGLSDAAPDVIGELSLGLRELLLNALEHGTLGLAYHDKAAALEQGALHALLEQRRKMTPYHSRSVTIVARRQEQQLEVEITDEGEGFDWRSLPDPTDPANLLAEHGRGVLLARLSVDELRYNETGNSVTVIKRLARPGRRAAKPSES